MEHGDVMDLSVLEVAREVAPLALHRIVTGGIREWAHEQRVRIPSTHNRTYAGECYDFARFPAISSLIFGFMEDPDARELFIMKDVQSTASTCALFSVGWMLANDPGNVIMITDTRDQMRDFAKDRIDAIFGQIPALRESATEAAVDSTALAKRFSGGVLYLGGGQSTTAVISKPAALMVLDEVSKHPLVGGMTTVALARGRGTGDDRAKLLAFSTPDDEAEFATNPNTGRRELVIRAETVLHSEYLSGTQEECRVPCPHCGHYQALQFERLRFEHCRESLPGLDGEVRPAWNKRRVAEETWYECANEECRGRILEEHKAEMLRRHRWVATNPNAHPGRRSAQISALYNIAFRSRTWGQVALAFLDAVEKGDAASMKAFQTEYLGKPFARYKPENTSIAKVRRLINYKYRRKSFTGELKGYIPAKTEEVRFVGCTVDVQGGHVKFLIFAVLWNGEIMVLDWGRTEELEDVQELMEVRKYSTANSNGAEVYEPALVYIDVNYDKKRVYQFIADNGGTSGWPRWEGIRGRDKGQTREASIRKVWSRIFPVSPGDSRMLRVQHIDASHWEGELYIERIDRYEPGKERPGHPRIHLPADVDEEFLKELCNMKQEYGNPNAHGVRELRWVKIQHGPNDYGDLLKYALVMQYAVEVEEGAQAAS